MCSRLFFVRDDGNTHTGLSARRLISDQRMPAHSSRRCPVIRANEPTSPTTQFAGNELGGISVNMSRKLRGFGDA